MSLATIESEITFDFLSENWCSLANRLAKYDGTPIENGVLAFIFATAKWNLGAVAEAMDLIRQARKLSPFNDRVRLAEIDYLCKSGQIDSALKCARQFEMEMGPVNESRYRLATLLLRQERFDEAQEWLNSALNHAVQPNPARILPTPIVSAARLLHDHDQLMYLIQREKLDSSYKHEIITIETLLRLHFGLKVGSTDLTQVDTEKLVTLSPFELASLARVHKRIVHLEPTVNVTTVLNSSLPFANLEKVYFSSDQAQRHVVVDNFLSSSGWSALREYCLCSWIWLNDDQKGHGYLGAYEHNGFRTPLVDQLDAELQKALPELLAGMSLLQVWSYRNVLGEKGIGVHADFAKVNINFWLTEDSENLDKKHGGLLIYPVARPEHWSFERYNGNDEEIVQLISRHSPTKVQYKGNRAVIFDSDLFHASDKPYFKDSHVGRRMNVTLLYG